MPRATRRFVGIWLAALLLAAQAHAGPWAAPGDHLLRQDIELLSDAGLINVPITTWPISWGDLARALDEAQPNAALEPGVAGAYRRLSARSRNETTWGYSRREYRVSLADNPRRLRPFEDTPRTNAEIGSAFAYTGSLVSARAQVTLAVNPADDRNLRFDGSFIGLALGNTTFNAGFQDKWWGPGWDGALALSNNARPVPGLLIKRNFTDPFEHPWLRWVGPWTASFFFGSLESSRAVPDTRFVGGRFAFKPFHSLEIGVTRTAQWGGDGRPQSLDSFFDLLIGRDNVGEGVTRDEEPGNQLAGYDWRWRVVGGKRPVVFYGQLIGEDEAGGFPSRFLGQFGLSVASPVGANGASVRVHAEFSDTTCQFNESSKLFNCAYNNSLYPDGYRYRGRAIGHTNDNDARQLALGASVVTGSGKRYSASVRFAKLNRGGAPDASNSLTATPSDLTNIELSHERVFLDGVVTAGFGLDSADSATSTLDGNDLRAFASWEKRF